jgi:hypothetical protein
MTLEAQTAKIKLFQKPPLYGRFFVDIIVDSCYDNALSLYKLKDQKNDFIVCIETPNGGSEK